MQEKTGGKLSPREAAFCRYYLLWGNLREAAAAAGYSRPARDGIKAFGLPQVQRELLRLRKKKQEAERCSEGFRRLAFGSITDAVRLLFLDEPPSDRELEQMDLFSISEIKRPKGGGMEIKFFDRQRALERLCELEQPDRRDGARAFYDALEKSAARLGGEDHGI